MLLVTTRLPRNLAASAPLVAAFLCALACTDVVNVPIDPEVDYGDPPIYVPTGEPELELGVYQEQLYFPLMEGGECPFKSRPQGGTWAHFAIRARGVGMEARLEVAVEHPDGRHIGSTATHESLALAPDGWIEVQSFPVPIDNAPSVDGEEAVIRINLEDLEGRSVEFTMNVVLVLD
jgi:hypothetical protein